MKRATSDSVGSLLEDKTVSDQFKSLKFTQTRKKKRFEHKQINYVALSYANSLLKLGKLKKFMDELDKQNILLVGLQEMKNATDEPFESQGYRI